MRNIAIFVSGKGAAAERIINLFNEGNRLRTVLLIATDDAKDILERISDKDVEKIFIPESEWIPRENEIIDLLKAKHVNLIVLDNFNIPLSSELIEAGGGKVLEVSSPETAPREVVATLEADLHKPVVEAVPVEKPENTEPTADEEWAETLKINFTPPKIQTTPPPVPEETIQPETNLKPDFSQQFSYDNNQTHDRNENSDEPMPSTYLIWSVLAAVFCCFIPGIVAIIFSSQVSSRYYSGDIEGAKRASKNAQIWIIVSVVLGILFATLYVPLMFIGN